MSLDDSIPRSIILVLLLAAAGFFAAAETAFSYCNAVRIRLLAEDGDKKASRVVILLDSYERTVVTLLIAINIIHVIAASIATVMAVELMGDVGSVVSTAIMTVAVFLFSETIPKNIARANADSMSLGISLPIMFFFRLFKPLAVFFLYLGELAKKCMKVKSEPAITEDELASIVEDVEDEGLIEPEETEIIKSAIEFGDIKASDIMLPRDKISAIPINSTPEMIKKTVIEEKYSRFPVYDGNIDHIVGIIQSTSCLWNFVKNKNFKIKELLTKPYYVLPETLVKDVFEGMGRKHTHVAIVRNAEGRNVGLLTMEDILEEIVGEIYDEDDETSSDGGAV